MKKYLIIALVLIASIGFSQTNVYFRTNQSIEIDNQKSVVLQHQDMQLSPAVTDMTNTGNDNSAKVAAVTGYILLNSFVITEYCISNKSYKESHPNPAYWQYPGIEENRNPAGMISTIVLSTGLLITVLIAL